MTKPVLLTTAQVAKRFKVSTRKVQRLAGISLPIHSVKRQNGGFLFKVSDVKKLERTF